MYIDKSNEVLMNHYRKQEIIKANERIKEGVPIIKVLQLADNEFITTDELLEGLYISKEQSSHKKTWKKLKCTFREKC